MEICLAYLTFENVDEILWCNHSKETSLAVLSNGTTVCVFQRFAKRNLVFFK